MRNLEEMNAEHDEVIEEHKGFAIKDLGTLGWAFQKLSVYEKKCSEVSAYAKAEIEKITAWEKAELFKHRRSMEFFESHIEHYHFNKLQEDPRAKTLSTPYGKSKSTTQSPSPVRVDEKVILEHLEKNGLDEHISKKPRWGTLKDSLTVAQTDDGYIAVDSNGEVVPGVIVRPEQTTFSYEVTE